jgi:hypothetical protein
MSKDKWEVLEDYQMVQYRMEAEGFHYCFNNYSSFEEIEDEEFHKLRLKYLKSAKKLKKYINNKVEQLEGEINDE